MASLLCQFMNVEPKFRRIFIDTEFTNLVDMGLISIGLVVDDDEFYAELNDFCFDECNIFVRESVLPHLRLVAAI